MERIQAENERLRAELEAQPAGLGLGSGSGFVPGIPKDPRSTSQQAHQDVMPSLQECNTVAGVVKGKDRDESISPTKPEAVQPGVESLPVLAEPKSKEGSLAYHDWLVVIGGLVGHFSDSASVWWAKVCVVDEAYAVWIASSPIDRFGVCIDVF